MCFVIVWQPGCPTLHGKKTARRRQEDGKKKVVMAIFRKKATVVTPAAPATTRAATTPPAKPETPVPQVDPLFGDPDAHRFRRELDEGRWQDFHDFLTAADKSIVRNHYIFALATDDGPKPWMDEWLAARPESGLPLLFRGRMNTNWAWTARGGGRASTVKEDAWDVFHQRLVAADKDFTQSAARDDGDPLPHSMGIWVAMGLSLGQQEVRRRFEESSQREPLNLAACLAMIQATAGKWGGSNEGMLEFARSVSARVPEGDSRHRLVALAHIEQWLDQPKEDQPAYFRSDAVKAEIRAAAGRCILSSGYSGGVSEASDRNAFAFCFYLMRDYEAQLEQMRLIGDHIRASPWQYQGRPPGRIYVRAKERALQAIAAVAANEQPAPGRPSL
jgi:hypothetical protein